MPEKDLVKYIVEILRMKKLFATEAYVALVVSLYNDLANHKGKDSSPTLAEIDFIFSECRAEFPENETK